MKILLAGGGTAGSVSPLLALVEHLRARGERHEFLFVGTTSGIPESEMAKETGIRFTHVVSAKLRRYISFHTLVSPFALLVGFFQSLWICLTFQPDVVVTAGGYVGVTVVWAAWLAGRPVVIHQPDYHVGLSLILTYRFATHITTVFQETATRFPQSSVHWIGNPIRQSFIQPSSEEARKTFSFGRNLPILLFVGGGTGAAWINRFVARHILELGQFANSIVITGTSRGEVPQEHASIRTYQWLDQQRMALAFSLASVVVTRGGIGVLSELAHLRKASIIVPLPRSPQEENAKIFERHSSAIVVQEGETAMSDLTHYIKRLVGNPGQRRLLGAALSKVLPDNAVEKLASIVMSTVASHG